MAFIKTIQKNQIFEVITDFGLSPNDFERSETPTEFALFLRKEKKLYFSFSYREVSNDFIINYVKFLPKFEITSHPSKNGFQFDSCLVYFKKWIREYILVYEEELNTINYWDDFEKHSREFSKNEKFSTKEAEVIEAALSTFPQYAKETLQLPEHQLQEIQKEIIELKEEVKKLSKSKFIRNFFWFIGKELFGMIIDNEKRDLIIQYFKVSLEGIEKYLMLIKNGLPR